MMATEGKITAQGEFLITEEHFHTTICLYLYTKIESHLSL